MDKAEQNSLCSSKGAFDAASLLAPTPPVLSHQMPVPATAPLFHLAHSPSAFSVLSQTSVLASHPSSSLSVSGKLCTQIGTDIHSSFTSSIPGCSTAVTHAHENSGRSELNDMLSLKHGSSSSSLHCHIPQPRRIVEEMLGHLYARPPSAEVKTEQPVSGIHNTSPQSITRTSPLGSSSPLISGKLLRAKTNSTASEILNSGKVSEKQITDSSDSTNASIMLTSSPVSFTTQSSLKNSGKGKSSESSTTDILDTSVITAIQTSSNKPKRKIDNSGIISVLSHNGEEVQERSVNGLLMKGNSKKKQLQKMLAHDSGSDTDVQSHESSSSSVTGESTTSSESVSESSNSETSEEENDDDQKRKKNLQQLRRRQQELRKKVEELKQASQEAQAQKAEIQAKKTLGPKTSTSSVSGSNCLLSSNMTMPSPAHSGSSLLSGSPCKTASASQDNGSSVLAPLDLCMKKQDLSTDSTFLPNYGFSSKTGHSHKQKHNAHKKLKRIEKRMDLLSSLKTENALESGMDNTDTDDTEQSAVENVPGDILVSISERGLKRHLLEEMEGPQKKKRILPEEKDIRIPLEHGWRRQTRIRCFSRSGVRGEVTYFAPCGKKLRNYPEVVRYLQRHGITDINRENFTFSTKINVGEFIEHAQGGGHDDYIVISEQEVIARIEEVRARKGRLGVQGRSTRQQEEEEEEQQKWEEVQLQHTEKHAEEIKKQKESQKLAKQQERIKRLEQLRLERELRAQEMLEARRKRQEELERQRCEEAMQKAQEMQKRREMLLMVDLERERRRQHMLLVRALEARKKQEERERKREEILYEKHLNKEKKLEQRRIELQMIREMKKPIEDMCLKDNTPLPTLNRIPGLKLAGKAFADIMMLFEFLHNFGETLGFDMENLPTLNTIQMALLNHDEKSEEELLSVVHHLLVCVIHDPGVHHCPEAVSVLGQNLRDVDVANNNVSEVLRLYLTLNNKNTKMWHWLNQRPFLALNPMQKAEILAFLCNELLCSRAVIRQIDNSIEAVNALRKDKWLIEGDLRKLKCIQQKRVHTDYIKQCVAEDNKIHMLTSQKNASSSNKNAENGSKPKMKNTVKNKKNTHLEDNESGNESDDIPEIGHISDGEIEDTALTNDELSKKIDRLNRQQNQYQNKLTKACHTIRATTFGQDRYKRRYWVLPYSGGIFVEGQESADPDSCDILETDSSKIDSETLEGTDSKNIFGEKDTLSSETQIFKPVEKKESQNKNFGDFVIKDENIKIKDDENIVTDSETKELNLETDLKKTIEWTDHNKSVSPRQNNIFYPFTDQFTKSRSTEKVLNSKLNSVDHDNKLPPNPLLAGDQNWFLQSPFFASILAGSMLFNGPLLHSRELNGSYFNFPKNNTSLQDNSFGNFLGFPPALISPEPITKDIEGTDNQSKPWFSILPRMPCEHNDKKSLEIQTTSHTRSISPIACTSTSLLTKHNNSHLSLSQHASPIIPNMSSNPSHAAAAAIANLHVELMNGMPPNLFLNPFLSPQSFGPTYQTNTSISSAQLNSTVTTTASESPSLQFTGSDFLPSLGFLNLPPASSTPSSIPTPSATPGPSHGSAPSSQRDTPSPSFCKKYFVEKQEQLDKPQPIPAELQRGWWRITDAEQLKTVLNALHPRGIREKMLQKQFQKLFSYACTACLKQNHSTTDLEITDLDREISQKLGGAPEVNSDSEWSRDVALRVDLSVLEHVESLEEKVASASMQVKGWKMRSKLSIKPDIIFYPVCDIPASVLCEQKPDTELKESTDNSNECDTVNNENESDQTETSDRVNDENADSEVTNDVTKERDEDDGDDDDDDDDERTDNNNCSETEQKYINPVEAAKERLLLLEAAIERRYLRAPLGKSNELKLSSSSSGRSQNTNEKKDDADEDDVPIGLLRWQDAVEKCKTSSQLAMCISVLENCVAWDKSIMRASCQFCHSGDNEEMLLLCDGCDKGYHTYCFKPKMESIPDGDWYCYECLSKVTGEKICVLCGKKGKLLSCDACRKAFHLACLEPPLSKMPKGKWSCSSCNLNKPKKTSKQKNSSKEKDKDASKDYKESTTKKSENSKPKAAEKREKSKINKDLSVCSVLLDELEKHEDAWPFLLPVNTKQFPTYRKIIKKAMDLSTMKNKLEGGIYKSREDVANDARLIFDNCETFNEDDSPVGQAGHRMRAFFECRWSELTST